MNKVPPVTLPACFLAICGLLGCQRQLAPREFLEAYENEASVSVAGDGLKVILLYQSPEYLAARQGLESGFGEEKVPGPVLDSLVKAYGKARYFRITFRPTQRGSAAGGTQDGIPETDMPARQAILGKRLAEVRGELQAKIRLVGADGGIVRPLTTAAQFGASTGAANSILVVFPGMADGRPVDPGKFEFVMDDLGLNLGTLKRRLAPPEGLRLKVAT